MCLTQFYTFFLILNVWKKFIEKKNISKAMRCDPDLPPQPAGPAGTSQLTCPPQRPARGKDSRDDDEDGRDGAEYGRDGDEDGHDKHKMKVDTLQ